MKYLLIIGLLAAPLFAQVPSYGHTSQSGAVVDSRSAAKTYPFRTGTLGSIPGTCVAGEFYWASDDVPSRNLHSCTSTNTWIPVGYRSGTSLPGTCVMGEVYFKTDATAGQNLYFCTATNTWTQQLAGSSLPSQTGHAGKYLGTDGTTASWSTVSGGGGSINTGAGKGLWWPLGVPSNTDSVNVNAGNAGNGRRVQIIVPATMEFRSINFWISVAAGLSKTFQAGIYTADMATQVAYTTPATSGGTPNINATGAARFMFSGGSMVSGGVLTITPGVYWVVIATDATAMVLMGNASLYTHVLASATTTTSETHAGATGTLMGATSSSAISTAGVLTANLSAMTWNPASQSERTPVFVLVN